MTKKRQNPFYISLHRNICLKCFKRILNLFVKERSAT
nr:MAG TPA: hypothetical protein [Caudoviricetes sp.]